MTQITATKLGCCLFKTECANAIWYSTTVYVHVTECLRKYLSKQIFQHPLVCISQLMSDKTWKRPEFSTHALSGKHFSVDFRHSYCHSIRVFISLSWKMSFAKIMMKKNKHKTIKLMNRMNQTSASFSFILHCQQTASFTKLAI